MVGDSSNIVDSYICLVEINGHKWSTRTNITFEPYTTKNIIL